MFKQKYTLIMNGIFVDTEKLVIWLENWKEKKNNE